MRARTVWGRLGKILIREGVDPRVSAMLYRGGGTGGTTFWLGDLGTLGGNREEGRGHTHGVFETYYGKSSVADSRQDMGDVQGGSSVAIGGN